MDKEITDTITTDSISINNKPNSKGKSVKFIDTNISTISNSTITNEILDDDKKSTEIIIRFPDSTEKHLFVLISESMTGINIIYLIMYLIIYHYEYCFRA